MAVSEVQFVQLMSRHDHALRAYSYVILPNWNFVEDAMQEALIVMWEKRDQLQSEDGFLPWARAIVRFKCLSQVQKLQRDRRLVSAEVLELVAAEDNKSETKRRGEAMAALRSCMSRFPTDKQQLLLAPYSDETDVLRIAAASGKTANALYKILGRLRAKLYKCVNEQLETCS